MKRHAGFSLIELMIVVALIGILVGLAAPFTSTWTDSAQVREAEGLLNQGIGRAKAIALRNRFGMIDSQASALLCLSQDNLLSLHEAASAGSEASCASPQTWSAQLPRRVALQNDGADFDCLALDARALPLGKNGCSTSQSFALSAGKEHVDLKLH
ncbi:Fimbrial protein precursor [compost metagenome]